jgi:outer membrane lipoprotein-sorting protein
LFLLVILTLSEPKGMNPCIFAFGSPVKPYGANLKMTSLRTFAASLLLSAIIIAPAAAQAKPGHLDEVLHQLDESSAKFRSTEADVRKDFYERVVRQTTTQTGNIFFKRESGKTIMGLKFLPPSARFIEYRDNILRIYDPGSNHLTIISTKDNQAQAESFLTLGFGGSGADLAKAWTISDLGTETMSDGDKMIPTAKLDLVSKNQSVRNIFTHIIIWVDTARGISLKQQFFTPSEDQQISTYTNIRYNQKVDPTPYAIKPAKNPTIDHH